MESPSNSSSGRDGSKDEVEAENALLLAAASLVPAFKGNLEAAHNAASDLKTIGDAKRSLIAYTRHKIRTEHILANWSEGVRRIIGQNNITRARPIFLDWLKTMQGDEGELTVRNTLILFGAHVYIFRGLKEWQKEGFTDADLMMLKNLFDSSKIPV